MTEKIKVGSTPDTDYVNDHPLVAALIAHERKRLQGYTVMPHRGDEKIRALFEMAGIPLRPVIVRLSISEDGSDDSAVTALAAPTWAWQIGGTIARLLTASGWREVLDGQRLVVLMRKARRDEALRAELLAVPRLTGNDTKSIEAIRDVLGGLVEKHLRPNDGD